MDTDEPKDEVNVKVEVPDLCLDENKKTLYEQVVNAIQAAKVASSKAYSAAQEVSYMLFPGEDERSPGKLFDTFSSPLLTSVESLDLSLSILQSIECEVYGGQSGLFLEDDLPQDDEIDNEDENDEDYENEVQDEDEKQETRPKRKSHSRSGTYTCDQCDYSTNTSRYLSYHKQTHMPGKYQCELCQFNKSKPYEMKLHMKKSHEIESIEYLVDREDPQVKYFLCQICTYLNPSQDLLQRHYEERHPYKSDEGESSKVKHESDDQVENFNGDVKNVKSEIKKEKEEGESFSVAQYSCNRCPYTTSNLKCYEDHIKGIYAYKKCPFCPKDFKAQRGKTFRTHLKKVHKCVAPDGNLKCTLCDIEFTKISKFEFHLCKDHNMGIKYHCPQCEYSTEKKSLYNLHIVEHGNAELPCPHCTFMAKSTLRLEKHIYSVHTQRQRKCKSCDIVFETQSLLNKHNRDIHGQIEICDECGYEGTSKMNLRYHKQQKHEEKTISCDQCGFMTTTQGLLNLHVKVKHLKYYEKKAVDLFCDQCDYSTKNKQSLKLHVNSKHLKLRYSCNLCDTTFASPISLRKHRKSKHSTHNDQKFRCEEKNCEYSTFCKDNLKCHVEKVHQGIRWPCDQCQYVGGYKGDLTRHMKVVHHGFILKCQLCDYSTPKKYCLSGHMLKVHGLTNEALEDTKIF